MHHYLLSFGKGSKTEERSTDLSSSQETSQS